MIPRSLLIFIVVCGAVNISQCAKILCVFQMQSYSHQVVFQPIWRELSLRGHQVTVLTPLPLKDPTLVNLTEIDLGYLKNLGAEFNFFKTVSVKAWPHRKTEVMFRVNYLYAEKIFKNEQFKKIYQNPNSKFDLIIIQSYVGPIFHALGEKYNAPVVGINSMNAYIGQHFEIGNPHHPAVYTDMYTEYQGELTFLERWYNTFFYLWARYFIYFDGMPKSDAIARKYLGNDIPYLGESVKKLSFLFTTTNPILYVPRPQVPTHMEIGRLHLKPTKPLPKDYQDYLDNAKEGVVYVSLGSNVLSSMVPEKFRNNLIEALGKIPYKVLWKYETDNLKNLPKNILTKKWVPQQDVLAHPNVKGFVMQCGLQSLEEAFSQNVPVVCCPFVSDQLLHIKRLEKFEAAIGINPDNVSVDEFKSAIMEITNNKKYKENVKKINDLWNDEPMKPLEKVIWWIEYVIRHNGTSHLKSPTATLPWYQFFLVDVISATLLVFFMPIYLLYLLFNKCCTSNKRKTSKKQKKEQ
ncbi:unnamed protein product [Brassicogethes aeneus]|uniref:UDP-glucuronosyltransferase n=1 Tax=Brassicogethes aeneus TaxID=1431903 RepID=A0A9P0BBW8_BRAAE|nr:unnamed protein product [Brassicogethes aeneus]